MEEKSVELKFNTIEFLNGLGDSTFDIYGIALNAYSAKERLEREHYTWKRIAIDTGMDYL